MGVPVIDINGHIIIGFDRAKIDKLLGLKWKILGGERHEKSNSIRG
jgi:hypothetical protein